MLWVGFLVAAAMLASCGPRASGVFTRDECGQIMYDDWFDRKYGAIELRREDRDFLDGCFHRVVHFRPREDVPGTRQECRTLSDDSRTRLFTCFNRMATSGRMGAIEALHRLQNARNAHFGPCFGPWHRFFLAIVEEALRTFCQDRSICLCYWDVTLDSALPNPCESAIYTDTYFGNEIGLVRTGPYANKQCLPDCAMQGGRGLFRQCGGAALSTENDILQIINAPSYGALITPYPISMFEGIHGENHMFVGGHMARITCSPCDCMFFFLHAFIDMLLNLNMQRRGANSDREYPQDARIPRFHRGNDLMQPFNTTCVVGLRFRPDATPYAPPVVSCTDHDGCGSKALWCNRGRCTGCVRGGARMVRGWPDRACYIQGCDTPVNMNGACGCANPPRRQKRNAFGFSDAAAAAIAFAVNDGEEDDEK